MARLPRLIAPGQAHYVIQRAHPAATIFRDAADRASFLDALQQAAADQRVQVLAYALLDDEVQLLLCPPTREALSRSMQSLGRRYVSAYNRRHGTRGTLWDGRFRCGVLAPGATLLAALVLIDGASTQPEATSAAQRLGRTRPGLVTDPPEFWRLGNTPFDREAAYGRVLAQGAPPAEAARLRHAALGGWSVGPPEFVAEVAANAARPARPRPRGRPALPR